MVCCKFSSSSCVIIKLLAIFDSSFFLSKDDCSPQAIRPALASQGFHSTATLSATFTPLPQQPDHPRLSDRARRPASGGSPGELQTSARGGERGWRSLSCWTEPWSHHHRPPPGRQLDLAFELWTHLDPSQASYLLTILGVTCGGCCGGCRMPDRWTLREA